VKHNNLLPIVIWVVIIGAAFAFAWWKGYVERLRNYWNATGDELRKCAWPSWEELKGSTVVVTITIALMGAFCYLVDTIFYQLVRFISSSVS
jgi:preprotein translocase SecE subunit